MISQQGQRKTHVAQADDYDFRLATLDAARELLQAAIHDPEFSRRPR